MKYLKLLFFSFLCSFFSAANAQYSLSGHVFASGGFDAGLNATQAVTVVIGEVFVETYSAGEYVFSNGLLQPLDLPTSVEPVLPSDNIKVSVYPNPAKDFIELVIANANRHYAISLYDLLGNKISWPAAVNELSGGVWRVPLPISIPPGMYLLHVRDSESQQTNHIIKLSVLK